MIVLFKKPDLKILINGVVLFACCNIFFSQVAAAEERKRQRFEVASLFHPADPFFGGQLEAFFKIVEANSDGKVRLRRSRKAPGFSAIQIIQSLSAGSIDGAMLDPVGLGFRPAIAQVFGGIPFGPSASKVLAWAESGVGRKVLDQEFTKIGVKPLVCGHSGLTSGVFSRKEFTWPNAAGSLAIHSQGLANETYESLNIVTRPLPPGDLYMGYASGVVDLLVSLNPSMDARAGFAQQSGYFYYPSWERTSAFALLLVSLKKWGSLTNGNRLLMEDACQSLNSTPVSVDAESAIVMIAEQGANNTIVMPWPPGFLQAARERWGHSALKLADRHPALGQAFKALDVPGVQTE